MRRLSVVWMALLVAATAGAAPADRVTETPLADRDGRSVRLGDGQARVVNLWASWCGPCREELPLLNTLSSRLPTSSVVLVSVDTSRPRARALVDHLDLDASVLYDGAPLAAALGLETLPTTYVIDAEGVVRFVHAGQLRPQDVATLEAEVRGLLPLPQGVGPHHALVPVDVAETTP